jgi:hypothetical protein
VKKEIKKKLISQTQLCELKISETPFLSKQKLCFYVLKKLLQQNSFFLQFYILSTIIPYLAIYHTQDFGNMPDLNKKN